MAVHPGYLKGKYIEIYIHIYAYVYIHGLYTYAGTFIYMVKCILGVHWLREWLLQGVDGVLEVRGNDRLVQPLGNGEEHSGLRTVS